MDINALKNIGDKYSKMITTYLPSPLIVTIYNLLPRIQVSFKYLTTNRFIAWNIINALEERRINERIPKHTVSSFYKFVFLDFK